MQIRAQPQTHTPRLHYYRHICYALFFIYFSSIYIRPLEIDDSYHLFPEKIDRCKLMTKIGICITNGAGIASDRILSKVCQGLCDQSPLLVSYYYAVHIRKIYFEQKQKNHLVIVMLLLLLMAEASASLGLSMAPDSGKYGRRKWERRQMWEQMKKKWNCKQFQRRFHMISPLFDPLCFKLQDKIGNKRFRCEGRSYQQLMKPQSKAAWNDRG